MRFSFNRSNPASSGPRITGLAWACLVGLAAAGLSVPAGARSGSPDAALAPRLLDELAFEPVGRADVQAERFVARGPGMSVLLHDGNAVLQLPGRRPTSADISSPSSSAAIVRLQLEGARSKAVGVGEERLAGAVNLVRGNSRKQWQLGLPQYRAVRFPKVYTGVDLVYYGSGSRLEYDFVVAPGADPGVIRFRMDGAEAPALDAQGELVFKTPAGELRQLKPVVYQMVDGKALPVRGEYRLLEGGRVTFSVGPYDRKRPLVIDPIITFANILGGAGSEAGAAVAVDTTGHVYLAGTTTSNDFPNPPGQGVTPGEKNADIYVIKLDPSGSRRVYTTVLGGAGIDVVTALAVDANGDVVLTGSTTSGDFPRLPDTTPALTSPQDAVVVRLGAAGLPVMSRLLGGEGQDAGLGIALDGEDGLYVVGHTESQTFPALTGVQTGHGGGGLDAFVSRVRPDGTVVVSTFLGGAGRDSATAVDVTPAGVAVAGSTSGDFPLAASQTQFSGGGLDGFVTLLSSGLSARIFSTYLGGTGEDQVRGLAADSQGNLYLTGMTTSTGLGTGGAAQSQPGGEYDAFVAKLNAGSTTRAYFSYLGGRGSEGGRAVAVGLDGTAYVTGVTYSPDFPLRHPVQTYAGAGDAFIARFTDAGTALDYSSYLGGSGYDEGLAIAADAGGFTYVAGVTSSASFRSVDPPAGTPPTPLNAFVAKLPRLVAAPAAPTNLSVTSVAPNAVTLAWLDVATDETAYEVLRAQDNEMLTPLAQQVPANATSFTDQTVSPGTTYRYRVRAIGLGGSSGTSNEVVVVVPAIDGPTNLTGTALSQSRIRLTWENAETSALRLELKRVGPGTTETTLVLPADQTSFEDAGLQANTTYTYEIRAVTAVGDSPWSNSVALTTLVFPAPTSLTAVLMESGIRLAWTDRSSSETGFQIERSTTGTGDWSELARVGANVTTHTDTTGQPNRTYYYRVRALSPAGNSDYSNTADATIRPLTLAGITVTPRRLNFTTRLIRTTKGNKANPRTRSVRVKNNSLRVVTVSTQLSTINTPSFTLGTTTGGTLQPGESLDLVVTYAGKIRGTQTGTLQIRASATDGFSVFELNVPLRGKTEGPRGRPKAPASETSAR